MRALLLLASAFFLTATGAAAQDDGPMSLPLRILDAATAEPVPSAEIQTPSGALLTLGDAQGFASIPSHAADSAFLIVRAAGLLPDTLFPPFSEEVFLRTAATRSIKEVVVRPDIAAPVIPSRRDAVIDYTFVGDYVLVATTRAPRKNALLLLSFRGDTVAHTAMQDEPDGVYTACDGTPYVIFSYLNRFQPVSSVQRELQLGGRYPLRTLLSVQACQIALNGALYYRSFSPQEFALSLWRMGSEDTMPRLFAQRIDTATARADEYEDGDPTRKRYWVRSYKPGESKESRELRLLRNKFVYREMSGNLMLLHDTLLLPDFRSRALVHYSGEGKELMAPSFRFSWGSLVQFSLVQDAATGRVYLHRYARPQAQTIQELDPRTGALVGREVPIQKAFAEKVQLRGGRIYYLWQDDRASGARQLFSQALPSVR